MKDDLISRRAIFHELLVYGGKVCPDYDVDGFPITIKVRDIKEAIRKMPSIEKPERQGKWSNKMVSKQDPVFGDLHFGFQCSECGAILNKTKYCGNCGAKMDGKDVENDGQYTL